MKQVVNFRLSTSATTTLSILEKKLHTSKTAIVEQALQSYAKKKLLNQKGLLEYAGILGAQEADSMLLIIESSKHNKDDINLEL